jgi:hypothetical protein
MAPEMTVGSKQESRRFVVHHFVEKEQRLSSTSAACRSVMPRVIEEMKCKSFICQYSAVSECEDASRWCGQLSLNCRKAKTSEMKLLDHWESQELQTPVERTETDMGR